MVLNIIHSKSRIGTKSILNFRFKYILIEIKQHDSKLVFLNQTIYIYEWWIHSWMYSYRTINVVKRCFSHLIHYTCFCSNCLIHVNCWNSIVISLLFRQFIFLLRQSPWRPLQRAIHCFHSLSTKQQLWMCSYYRKCCFSCLTFARLAQK